MIKEAVGYRLIPGFEKEACIHILVSSCNLKSEAKIAAVVDHLVNGTQQEVCAVLYGLAQSTIAEAVTRLNHAHKQMLQYHEAYMQK
ncbi:PapB/FocB family fimbrial expression transcriptional regulator [Alteromonas macleodii]|uniref:Adhesin biosynthesis transcription regulatory family protein n=1 Tax=Alteromonas macleodii TaxID=28108 RepID=A0AB36FL44_ALTMA|nr:PapB/FocB family fimbrial expression transcriptional regulator [Alteromonas macleodii]OES24128.1 adhesin biosynthesis transcription regulatory family protein [Alteromonas macleodii]OES24762.1 adhesin biosynthesis transcription regulatory family protein [Alteromonas macleodii]OES25040.1 adhesin biosynthesis transcription regulatory family protein [Alteromonas macleodii]OES39083.1 adhesin biosynthesis transcription regulatory family protein [Alteromonas macleodii]